MTSWSKPENTPPRHRVQVMDERLDCPRLKREVAIERCLECGWLLYLDARDGLIVVCTEGAEADE